MAMNGAERPDSPWTLWTFTGVLGVRLRADEDFHLADGLGLHPTSPLILSRRSHQDLNVRQQRQMEEVGHYLVYKCRTHRRDPLVEEGARGRLLNALMAIQIVKPSPSLGCVLQFAEAPTAEHPIPGPVEMRAPMDPGQWAALRDLDRPLLEQATRMVRRVDRVMAGTDSRRKNAIHLFQLALEHYHPAIACLLAVASMEACLDTWKAEGFETGLCSLLGSGSLAFPDWNSPVSYQPRFTVGELAFDLHRLRSAIVHGNDLLHVKGRGGCTIDFGQLRDFIDQRQRPAYIQLLCESSICLASQVLQQSI